MLKYSKSLLKKLELFLSEQGYKLIYEKGQFNSGYCIVNHSKVVVINKFYNIEGKINTIIEIIPQLELNEGLFSDQSRSLLENINGSETTLL